MTRAILSRLTGKANAVRRFDGAATGRRWSSSPTFDNIIYAEMLAEHAPVRRRAAWQRATRPQR